MKVKGRPKIKGRQLINIYHRVWQKAAAPRRPWVITAEILWNLVVSSNTCEKNDENSPAGVGLAPSSYLSSAVSVEITATGRLSRFGFVTDEKLD